MMIAFLKLIIFIATLLFLAKPLAHYMVRVFEQKSCGLDKLLGPLERGMYRLCRIRPTEEMNWKTYAVALFSINVMGIVFAYAIQRLQGHLPLNPQQLISVDPILALNTAISFVTNTNWQAYSGEMTMSYFTQMMVMTVQNFLSAATGLAVIVALIRGLTRKESNTIGNYWVDIVRSILYILLPLAFIAALLFVSQGVIQNFSGAKIVQLQHSVNYEVPKLDATGTPVLDSQGQPVKEIKTQSEQVLPQGPVASQIAIKSIGTNGGGYFNANAAHPYENPTIFSNIVSCIAMLLIPTALCFLFGLMVNDSRQGIAILVVMLIIFIPLYFLEYYFEKQGNPLLNQQVTTQTKSTHPIVLENLEGKESRFGVLGTTLFVTTTTATGTGATNAAHDSLTPLGGLIPMLLIQLSEVVFGGVGSGLYTMIIFVLLTVFIAGLMVGRTPEYLGKKIEPFEIKMASLVILICPLLVHLGTAITVVSPLGVAALGNPGAHGFSEVLYAFSSMTNNNGSAFAGLNANNNLYNLLGALMMFVGRFWVIIPVLAIAGALARKKIVPNTLGTLPTHTPLFIGLLLGIVIIVGALGFFPSLALGPIVEHLMML